MRCVCVSGSVWVSCRHTVSQWTAEILINAKEAFWQWDWSNQPALALSLCVYWHWRVRMRPSSEYFTGCCDSPKAKKKKKRRRIWEKERNYIGKSLEHILIEFYIEVRNQFIWTPMALSLLYSLEQHNFVTPTVLVEVCNKQQFSKQCLL